jgi:hypothetical protein
MNKFPRLLILLPTLLTFVLGWTAANGQDPAPKYRQEYHVLFKGTPDKDPGFRFIGPDAEQCVHFEPDGLRIKLPTGVPKERAPTGLSTGVVVRGDYEITLHFAVLKEPEPKNAGPIGTRFGLLVGVGTEQKPKGVARVTWSTNPQFGPRFIAWTDADAAEQHIPTQKTTTARKGKLRLVRHGPALAYFAAEEESDNFLPLQEHQLGEADLRDVSIVAQTNSPQAELDVRFTELHIRAESLPTVPAQLLQGEATPAAAPAEQTGGLNWLLALELLGLLLCLAVACSLGVWLYRRQAAATRTSPSNTTPAIASFQCVCGKKLNVKADLAGKKVKCSQCGQAILVPGTRLRETELPGS